MSKISLLFWRPWSELSFRKAHKAGTTCGLLAPDSIGIQHSRLNVYNKAALDVGNDVEEQWTRSQKKLEGDENTSRKSYKDSVEEYKYATQFRSNKTPPGNCQYIEPIIYWLLMLILFIGELPLNTIVMRVLSQMEIFNIVVAAAIGALLLFFAHVIGNKMKSYVVNPTDKVAISVLLGITGIVLVAIALVREIYMKDKTQADTTVTMGLIAIQCLIFCGAVVAGYAHAMPTTREKLAKSRDGFVRSWVNRRKLKRAYWWDVRKVRNAVDRVKDEFVASYLTSHAITTQAPLPFYILDFDDEEILKTPGTLRETEAMTGIHVDSSKGAS